MQSFLLTFSESTKRHHVGACTEMNPGAGSPWVLGGGQVKLVAWMLHGAEWRFYYAIKITLVGSVSKTWSQ